MQQDFCDVTHPVLKGRESTQDTGRSCAQKDSIKGANRHSCVCSFGPRRLSFYNAPGKAAGWWEHRDEQRAIFLRAQGSQINPEGDEDADTSKQTVRHGRGWFKPQMSQRNVTNERKARLKGCP